MNHLDEIFKISSIPLYGIFECNTIDHLTGEIVDTISDKNVVVLGARDSVAKAIGRSANGEITRIKIGDDVGTGVALTGNPNLTFADNGVSPDTIVRDGGSWTQDGFLPKMSITITGTASNNNTFTIESVNHQTITLVAADTLTNEGPVGSVNISGTASADNPEPGKESYDKTSMGTPVFSAPYDLSVSYPAVGSVTFSVTIIGQDVIDLYPSESFKNITSAALHTGNDDLFAYKRFPQRSISPLLDLAISWTISVVDPDSLVCGAAPFSLPIKTVYAAYSVTSDDYTVVGDATSGAFAIELPLATGIANRIYTIKKIDSTANAISVTTAGSGLIDGSATYNLPIQYDSVTIQSDGTNWHVL